MEELRVGSKGLPVEMWQRLLVADGWDLGRWGADGDFGGITHNATVGVQSTRGLARTGVVDAATLVAILNSRILKAPISVAPQIKLVQARNYTPATLARDIKWIVLHSMEAGEASTTAENVAGWFAGANAPKVSAHYCADDDSVVQCVLDKDVAWCAKGGNRHGLHIEQAGYARQTRDQWLDAFGRRMLERVAQLCATKCAEHNIPVRFVDADGILAGERGITYHGEVSKAAKVVGGHTDPGPSYPIDWLLQRILEIRG